MKHSTESRHRHDTMPNVVQVTRMTSRFPPPPPPPPPLQRAVRGLFLHHGDTNRGCQNAILCHQHPAYLCLLDSYPFPLLRCPSLVWFTTFPQHRLLVAQPALIGHVNDSRGGKGGREAACYHSSRISLHYTAICMHEREGVHTTLHIKQCGLLSPQSQRLGGIAFREKDATKYVRSTK